jgi:hypothetical protein
MGIIALNNPSKYLTRFKTIYTPEMVLNKKLCEVEHLIDMTSKEMKEEYLLDQPVYSKYQPRTGSLTTFYLFMATLDVMQHMWSDKNVASMYGQEAKQMVLDSRFTTDQLRDLAMWDNTGFFNKGSYILTPRMPIAALIIGWGENHRVLNRQAYKNVLIRARDDVITIVNRDGDRQATTIGERNLRMTALYEFGKRIAPYYYAAWRARQASCYAYRMPRNQASYLERNSISYEDIASDAFNQFMILYQHLFEGSLGETAAMMFNNMDRIREIDLHYQALMARMILRLTTLQPRLNNKPISCRYIGTPRAVGNNVPRYAERRAMGREMHRQEDGPETRNDRYMRNIPDIVRQVKKALELFDDKVNGTYSGPRNVYGTPRTTNLSRTMTPSRCFPKFPRKASPITAVSLSKRNPRNPTLMEETRHYEEQSGICPKRNPKCDYDYKEGLSCCGEAVQFIRKFFSSVSNSPPHLSPKELNILIDNRQTNFDHGFPNAMNESFRPAANRLVKMVQDNGPCHTPMDVPMAIIDFAMQASAVVDTGLHLRNRMNRQVSIREPIPPQYAKVFQDIWSACVDELVEINPADAAPRKEKDTKAKKGTKRCKKNRPKAKQTNANKRKIRKIKADESANDSDWYKSVVCPKGDLGCEMRMKANLMCCGAAAAYIRSFLQCDWEFPNLSHDHVQQVISGRATNIDNGPHALLNMAITKELDELEEDVRYNGATDAPMKYLTALVDFGVLGSSLMDICDHLASLPQPEQYSVYFGRIAGILEHRFKSVPRTPFTEEVEEMTSGEEGNLNRKEATRREKLQLRKKRAQGNEKKTSSYRGDSPDLTDGFSKDDTDQEAEE